MLIEMTLLDLIGMLVSFVLTVLVLLYAFDDNALFRVAVYLFVGVAAGYASAVALKDVIFPRMFGLERDQLLLVLLWIVLLAMKLSPRTARIGNPAAGLLVGVGAAVAVGGSIQGTLIPQVLAAGDFFAPSLMRQSFQAGFAGQGIGYLIRGLAILVGTVATLAHFHFGAKPAPNQIPQRYHLIEIISKVGQFFIAVTFGVIFAGIYSATLTALVERLAFIYQVIQLFISGL
ncbi:MAG: hypothetical protein JW757_12820 [Anaerolineales bacterium]|nr:hypothetical protein [Anaerolineales bacterium]